MFRHLGRGGGGGVVWPLKFPSFWVNLRFLNDAKRRMFCFLRV